MIITIILLCVLTGLVLATLSIVVHQILQARKEWLKDFESE
jgi:hypothetical protein